MGLSLSVSVQRIMFRYTLAFASGLALSLPGVILFVLLFWAGVCQNQMSILMYRGLFLACIAAFLHAALLAYVLRISSHREHAVMSAVSLGLSVNVIFLVIFPVTIDRSVSVYLLGQLSGHPAGMTETELSEQLVRQYVVQYRGVDRRMREQISTGNVELQGDRFFLTQQGKNFIYFSGVVTDLFGIDPRFVRSSPLVASPSHNP